VRATLLVLVALAAAVLLLGCGSSGDQTASGGFTVPGDVHGLSGELESVLDQLPYQHWYTRCVILEVENALSPAKPKRFRNFPNPSANRS
jgi:hypothetical protein